MRNIDIASCHIQAEFLGAIFGSCIYAVSFILCIEWLPTRYRLLAGCAMFGTYAVGDILLGTVAMAFPHYRLFLIVIYVPGLAVIVYLFIIPESPRWLHADGHYDTILKALNKQAARNNRILSSDSIAYLSDPAEDPYAPAPKQSSQQTSVAAVFRNVKLFVRLVACSLLWSAIVFTYYGISVKSTKLADDDDKVRNFSSFF